MQFGELFGKAGLLAQIPDALREIEVSDMVTDSREVKKHSVFICLVGGRYDGHSHIKDAIEAGADVIVAENVRSACVGGAAIVKVDSTRNAAALLYNAWHGSPAGKLKIMGVTGTNGKSSTVSMLCDIFEYAGHRCGMIGTLGVFSVGRRKITFNGEASMTTPSPQYLYHALSEMVRDGAEYVFTEVSSHALAQSRVDAIEFDTAVFTNLSEDHLDFHKNFENYFAAKEKLFSMARNAVINVDNIYGKRLYDSLKARGGLESLNCTSRMTGDFCALDEMAQSGSGIEYTLKYRGGSHRVFLPLFGDFQTENSLSAAAVALTHGIDITTVCGALENMRGISGRFERVRAHEKQDFEIFIDYAHTPDALERLLKSARTLLPVGGRLIVLFGCGGEREREKRRAMGRIATRLADFTVITSDNPRSEDKGEIIRDILLGIDKEKAYTVIEDRREAISFAVSRYAKPRDILLLAGKGHERYVCDAKGTHDFDERNIVCEALVARYG